MSTARQQTVIVVGAAGGIGLEILRQLKGKVRILAVVQTEQQIAAARDAGAAQCLVCDISDAADTRRCVAAVGEQLDGPLRGVILTAAIQPVGAVELLAREDLERTFSVNVFGTLQFLQGMVPQLRESRGRVVLFSSMAGRLVAPMLGAYSATKYALEALADGLRAELGGSGVTVSLIEPGGVDTPMAHSQGEQTQRALSRLDAGQRRLYEPLYLGYQAMTSKALKHASRPEAVARVAVTAVLQSGRPKARYVVGVDAKLMVGLKKLLPTRWFDRLLISASTRK